MTDDQIERVVALRSADGRGPLFWAYEAGSGPLVEWLLARGADERARDVIGLLPVDLAALGEIHQEL